MTRNTTTPQTCLPVQPWNLPGVPAETPRASSQMLQASECSKWRSTTGRPKKKKVIKKTQVDTSKEDQIFHVTAAGTTRSFLRSRQLQAALVFRCLKLDQKTERLQSLFSSWTLQMFEGGQRSKAEEFIYNSQRVHLQPDNQKISHSSTHFYPCSTQSWPGHLGVLQKTSYFKIFPPAASFCCLTNSFKIVFAVYLNQAKQI